MPLRTNQPQTKSENSVSEFLSIKPAAASTNGKRIMARSVPLSDIKEAYVVANNSRDDGDASQGGNPCVRRDAFHPLKYWDIE